MHKTYANMHKTYELNSLLNHDVHVYQIRIQLWQQSYKINNSKFSIKVQISNKLIGNNIPQKNQTSNNIHIRHFHIQLLMHQIRIN